MACRWIVVSGYLCLGLGDRTRLRRRYAFNVAGYPQPESVASSTRRGIAPAGKNVALGNGFFGGPRQVSLRLTASKPSLRHTALPSAKLPVLLKGWRIWQRKRHKPLLFTTLNYANCTRSPNQSFESESVGPVVEYPAEKLRQGEPESPSFTEPAFGSAVGPVIEQTAETLQPSAPKHLKRLRFRQLASKRIFCYDDGRAD